MASSRGLLRRWGGNLRVCSASLKKNMSNNEQGEQDKSRKQMWGTEFILRAKDEAPEIVAEGAATEDER